MATDWDVVIENYFWLLEMGEYEERALERLGVKRDSLQNELRKRRKSDAA